MVTNQSVFLSLEEQSVSNENSSVYYHTLSIHIGIEAQLLSQVAIDRGDNVTFPMNDSNIPVESRVPNPTISMQ